MSASSYSSGGGTRVDLNKYYKEDSHDFSYDGDPKSFTQVELEEVARLWGPHLKNLSICPEVRKLLLEQEEWALDAVITTVD